MNAPIDHIRTFTRRKGVRLEMGCNICIRVCNICGSGCMEMGVFFGSFMKRNEEEGECYFSPSEC
jgi:hypothetical protein